MRETSLLLAGGMKKEKSPKGGRASERRTERKEHNGRGDICKYI